MATNFVVTGKAVITKIEMGANARKKLQNIAVKIDTSAIQRQLQIISNHIRKAFAPLQRLGNASTGVNKVTKSFNKLNTAIKKTNRSGKQNEAIILQVIRKASAFRISTILINGFFNAFSSGFAFLLKFDASMRNINKILRTSDENLNRMGVSLVTLAQRWNLTSEEVAKAARTTAQAGLGGNTAIEKQAVILGFLEKAALAAASSTLSFEQAQEALLAIMRQTNSTAEYAAVQLAKFSAVEDAAAVTAQNLAVVFQKAGTSIALAFGSNLDRAIGSISALLERTRQSDRVVGTFIKTLSARLSGANKEATAAFRELGISIQDTSGKLKDPARLVKELGVAIEGLPGEEKGRLLGRIFGVRQAELGKAYVEVLKEGGRAADLTKAAQSGFAVQLAKAAEEGKKFQAQINKISRGMEKLVLFLQEDVLGPWLRQAIAFGEKFLGLLDGMANKGNLLRNILGGIAVFMASRLTNQLFGGGVIAAAQGKGPTGFQRHLGRNVQQFQGPGMAPGVPSTGPRAHVPFAQRMTTGGAVGGRHVGSVNRGFIKLSKNLGKANKAIPAFSVRAIGASIAFQAVANILANSGNTIAESAAPIADTFGQFIIAGPKVAIVAAGLKAVGILGSAVATRLKTLGGSVSGAAVTLDKWGKGIEAERRDAIKNLKQDLFVRQFRGSMDELKKEVGLFGTFVQNIVTQNVETAIPRLKSATAGEDDIKAITASIRRAISQELAQLENQTPGASRILSGDRGQNPLLTNKKLLSSITDPALVAQLNRPDVLPGESGMLNLVETLTTAVLNIGRSRAVSEFGEAGTTDVSPISDAMLKQMQILAKQDTLVATATQALIAKEEELLRVRSGAGAVEQARTLMELTTARNKLLVQTAQIELDNQKTKIRSSIKEQIATKEREIADISAARRSTLRVGGTFTADQFAAMNVQVSKLEGALEILVKRQRSLNETLYENDDVRKLEINRVRQTIAAITSNAAATNELITAQKAHQMSLTSMAIDTATGVAAFNKARAALLSFNDNQSTADEAKVELANIRAVNALKEEGFNREIKLLKAVHIVALQNRKQEVDDAIKTIKESPISKGPQTTQQLDALIKLRASLVGKEKQLNEEVHKKETKRAQEVLAHRTRELQQVRKGIAAERALGKVRLATAAKLGTIANNMRKGVQGLFEAQKGITDAIRSKMDEAASEIKGKRGDLDSAFSSLASARQALTDGMKNSADAIVNFSLAVAKAGIAADSIMGVFSGFQEEASAMSAAFEKTISAAQAAGASETKLAELRNEAAKAQLAIYSSLLSETQSQARQYFTTSNADRQNYVQGLSAINAVVAQFGGNVEQFRGLSEQQLNEFGRGLIGLPQEVRQSMLNALDLLPSGAQVGGLTKGEIEEVLLGGAFGESEKTGIDRLSETMQIVADLTRKVADTDTAALISDRESLIELRAAVAEAREGVTIAKAMLAQSKMDASLTQKSIAAISSTLTSEVGTLRESFQTKADDIIRQNKDPQVRLIKLQELQVEYLKQVADKMGNVSGNIGMAGPGVDIQRSGGGAIPVVGQQFGPGREILDTIGKGIQSASKDLKESITGFKSVITGTWANKMEQNIKASEDVAAELKRVVEQQADGIQAEININAEKRITVTGAAEIVQSLVDAMNAEGFADEQTVETLRRSFDVTINKLIDNGVLRQGDVPR